MAKDLYDEDAIAERLYGDFLEKHPGINVENNSILGTKSRNLAKEAGELAAVYGLQAVGIPWWLTTGVNAFGNEAEHAVNEGASYDEAAVSGLISAGADILTEIVSRELILRGKTVSNSVLKIVEDYIPDKMAKKVIQRGLNSADEGFEEVFINATIMFGQWLTYQDEKTLKELVTSEEMLDETIEAFWRGVLIGVINGDNQ